MVNKVILVGNAGRDAEVRSLPNGGKVASVNIATTERVYDSATQGYKDHTEWHSISFFGKIADVAEKYLKKGQQVYIEGKLRTRDWVDDKGSTHYTTSIICDEMKLLGKKPSTSAPEDDEDWS
jgi:single-strand DNA-binding protein